MEKSKINPSALSEGSISEDHLNERLLEQRLPMTRGDGVSSIIPSDDDTNKAYGKNSAVLGHGNTAGNPDKIITDPNDEGRGAEDAGYGAFASGLSSSARGRAAHAEGEACEASGAHSHAEGNHSIASGKVSHSEGSYTTASGEHSHAEGNSTTASGAQSHAEGESTTASGAQSHAEGASTTASGNRASTKGYQTTASADDSFAIGNTTSASGKRSFASGHNVTVEGDNGHGEGYNNVSKGFAAHIEGGGNTTSNNYEHAQGHYNASHTGSSNALKTAHSIGIGTADDKRKNAEEVMMNGDKYIIGIGGYDGTNPEASRTLQEVINDKQDFIDDLDAIRAGATKGATALQTHQSLTAYAKTADVNAALEKKQDALTLTVKDNGNIVLSNIQGQSKEFMPASPSGDPLHWVYIKRGAEYNDTGASIVKTAPWADLADDEADKTVVHKAGRWYLNGIGDLTTEEIRNIYHFQPIFECVGRGINYLLCQNPCRVFFDMISNAMTIGYNFENVSYASSALVLPFKTARASKLSGFIYNSAVKHILGTLETINNANASNAFETTTLKTLKLVKLCANVTFKKCSQLTLKSILYMIQNEAATSAITITLHADVYAKAIVDAEILAALEQHTNVSLASA